MANDMYMHYNGSKKCNYTFLADEGWFDSNIRNPSYKVLLLEYVHVLLEWTVSYFTTINSTKATKQNASCPSTKYKVQYCYCLRGYEGNPYQNTRPGVVLLNYMLDHS